MSTLQFRNGGSADGTSGGPSSAGLTEPRSSSSGGSDMDPALVLPVPADLPDSLQRLKNNGELARLSEEDPAIIVQLDTAGLQARMPHLNEAEQQAAVAHVITHGTGMTEISDAFGQPSRHIFSGSVPQYAAAMNALAAAGWLHHMPGVPDAGKLWMATGVTPNTMGGLISPFSG